MVAIAFPCAIIFADDNPIGGFVALALQASIIGWIPAVIWAWKIIHPSEQASVDQASDTTTPQSKQAKADSKGNQ